MNKNLTVGQKIKHYRLGAGLTQCGLADLIKVKQVEISRYENDKVMPNTKRALKLCKALGITISKLFN